MRTTFQRCFLVNFAVEPSALRSQLPPHIEPEIHDGRGYVSIVIAEMYRMRPAFLPPFLGVTYTQVVYRAAVRCGTEKGVAFLRSDANNRPMVTFGNAVTFFRFNLATVSWEGANGTVDFSLTPRDGSRGRILAKFEVAAAGSRMPNSSRFADIERADAFLTERYTAFGGMRADGRVEVVRLARTPWRSQVVADRARAYEAMESGLLFSKETAELDSIFFVQNISYRWNSLALEHLSN